MRVSNELSVIYSAVARREADALQALTHIDAALEKGREEMDPDKRKQLYADLEKQLMEIAPGVPLIDQYSVWALRSNVSGLKFNGFTYPIVSDLALS